MADDDEAIPPEILDFFRQVRELVDQTVERLEQAAPGRGRTDVTVNLGTGGNDVYAYAGVATAYATVPQATVLITPESVEAAKSWLASWKARAALASGGAWWAAESIDVLEGLISFVERMMALGQ